MNPLIVNKRSNASGSPIAQSPKRIKKSVSLELQREVSLPHGSLKVSHSSPDLENNPQEGRQELECRVMLSFIRQQILDPSFAMVALDQFVERTFRKINASYQDLEEELRSGSEGPLWKRIQEVVQKGQRQVQELNGQDRIPTFVTGSGSAALIGIDEVARTALSQYRHALVPSGQLLEAGIVPLTGKLQNGIQNNGVNLEHLSGVILERLETAVSFATQYLSFDLQQSKRAIQTFNPQESSIQHLILHLLRFLKCGGSADPEWAEMREALLQRQDLEPFKDRILPIVQKEASTSLAMRDWELVNNPFPLIWGAHFPQNDFVPIQSGIKGERAIKGSLALGDPNGVTAVFTKKHDVPRMREWLGERGLKVVALPLSALYYCSLREKVSSHADFSPFWQAKGFAANDPEFSARFCAEAYHPLERFELAKIAYQAFPEQLMASIEQFQLSRDDMISLREMVVRKNLSLYLRNIKKFPF
jgi:hypothetical protein